MLLQQHLDLAIRAHNGTSFSPERRGAQYIKEFSEQLAGDLEILAEKGIDSTEYQAKYERLFVSWMHAKSNGCWQRQLTDNARHAAKRILS